MTDKELKIKYNEICKNLADRKLKPAFDLIGKLIQENNIGIYSDEYRNLEQTYHYMLQYTVEGIKDPERQKVYRKLIVSAFELADKVYEELQLKFSTSIVYEKKRSLKGSVINLGELIVELEDYYSDSELNYPGGNELGEEKEARKHQQKIVALFYQLWLSNNYAAEEKTFLKQFFSSTLIKIDYKSFIVSAIVLSLKRYFSVEKFKVLFELYESDEIAIGQMALVGLLINLYNYDSRMQFYPDITGRLKILNENPEFKRNLERIIVQFIRSKETEKIQQKIRDEIIPEMIKISPNLKDKINLDSLMDEGLGEDKNPEWEEIFKDSPGLINKMEEFSELQMEGADVFMGSFAMLKMFPFFNEFANWFMPFFMENPEIATIVDVKDKTNQNFIESFAGAPILCNSDKYSFCFSIQNLPEENKDFMAHGMKAEMDQLEEIGKDEELTAPDKKPAVVSNLYIQDLYRFFKLHPRKKDFEDIFNWRFDFHNKTTFADILHEDLKVLRNIAEYYFDKNYFEEAAEIYSYLLTKEKNGELYQKIAYCHQKLGDYQLALDEYLKAELYDLNRKWNLKKIALCYRNLKQPDNALKYYKEVEKIDSDDLNNQLNISHSLLELKLFDQALKGYFKVEYLSPGNKKVWRPIGWCSFITGKREQAEKYFQKLMEDKPNKHDLLNMGHVQWSLGNRREALENYKKSISESGFSEAEFLEVFEEDLPILIEQGIDKNDVPIMLDQLRYFVEN